MSTAVPGDALKVVASSRWLWFGGSLAFTFVAVAVYGLVDEADDSLLIFLGLRAFLAFFPLGFAELATRQYEFGVSEFRFRKFFLWQTRVVPLRLALFVTEDRVLLLLDADTATPILRLTREFTRSGSLVHELADFYRQHSREVRIVYAA